VTSFELDGAAALEQYAPAAAAAFRRVQDVRPSGLYDEVLESPPVAAFAEQFRADVSRIDERLRSDFADATGKHQLDVAQMVWISDMSPRLTAALDAVFAPSTWPVVPRRVPVADVGALIESFQASVALLGGLDPITTELVRLRGARQHQCRVCSSRRSVAAIEAGADDATFAAVDRHEESDLSPAAKAALALTDAIIWTPLAIPASVVADARRELTPAQAVEVVLDVVRNAANKVAVALGADAPAVTEGVELFVTEPDGTLTVV
jgi:alkylhydroperoxidase family enzyme